MKCAIGARSFFTCQFELVSLRMLFRSLLCPMVGFFISSPTFCNKPADPSAVKASWSQIKASLGDNAPETVGRLIFENLFRDYPYMMNFFKNYGNNAEEIMANKKFMWHAKERVFGTFDKIISNLENKNEINSITSWLSKVHEPKGVKPTDFLNLGTAIVKTIEQALGSSFTPEVKYNWATAITELMTGIGTQIKK